MAIMKCKNLEEIVLGVTVLLLASMATTKCNALVPYITSRSLWDTMLLPPDDPFRILEQTPVPIPKNLETLALARADWKETPASHVITLDIPGMNKDDVKIAIEDGRVLRVSGERKSEEEVQGEKWHRVERMNGKFWRQFRLPSNADLDHINANIENGVLRIVVPKLVEEHKIKPKVVNIVEESASGHDIKATKADS